MDTKTLALLERLETVLDSTSHWLHHSANLGGTAHERILTEALEEVREHLKDANDPRPDFDGFAASLRAEVNWRERLFRESVKALQVNVKHERDAFELRALATEVLRVADEISTGQ